MVHLLIVAHIILPGLWLDRRGGPDECPSRTPYITPSHLLFWGWAKDVAYKNNLRDIVELEVRIREVLGNVPVEFLLKAIKNIPKRINKLIGNEGDHIVFFLFFFLHKLGHYFYLFCTISCARVHNIFH